MFKYKCPHCGYTQDFNPNDEEKMKKIFPELEVEIEKEKRKDKNFSAKGLCPSCFLSTSKSTKQFNKLIK